MCVCVRGVWQTPSCGGLFGGGNIVIPHSLEHNGRPIKRLLGLTYMDGEVPTSMTMIYHSAGFLLKVELEVRNPVRKLSTLEG